MAAIGLPARAANFKIEALTDSTPLQLDFRFRDLDQSATLNDPEEYVDVVTYVPEQGKKPQVTWRIQLDTTKQSMRNLILPGAGDSYYLYLNFPFNDEDVFEFTTTAEFIDKDLVKKQFKDFDPYVVPNPYVGSASFEPERFAISGRGERRIEFRGYLHILWYEFTQYAASWCKHFTIMVLHRDL